MAGVSKLIQKEVRGSMRAKCQTKIKNILSEFRSLENIAAARSNGRRKYLPSMRDSMGIVRDERQGVLDVFAEFYKDLYRTRLGNDTNMQHSSNEKVPRFSGEEVTNVLKKMAKGKAGNSSGIVVEMLQKM